MASNVVIAKRYAKALMSVCGGDEGAKSALSPLSALVQGVLISNDFSELIKSPAFNNEDKWSVIKEVAEKVGAPAHLVKFLKVLTMNGRAQVLPELEQVFKAQVLALDALVEAEVETAIMLSDAQLAQLSAVLSKAVAKKVKLRQKLVPGLIAGIKVNILGKLLDASFASNLELVHRELLIAQA